MENTNLSHQVRVNSQQNQDPYLFHLENRMKIIENQMIQNMSIFLALTTTMAIQQIDVKKNERLHPVCCQHACTLGYPNYNYSCQPWGPQAGHQMNHFSVPIPSMFPVPPPRYPQCPPFHQNVLLTRPQFGPNITSSPQMYPNWQNQQDNTLQINTKNQASQPQHIQTHPISNTGGNYASPNTNQREKTEHYDNKASNKSNRTEQILKNKKGNPPTKKKKENEQAQMKNSTPETSIQMCDYNVAMNQNQNQNSTENLQENEEDKEKKSPNKTQHFLEIPRYQPHPPEKNQSPTRRQC